jgi:hypothetical protein
MECRPWLGMLDTRGNQYEYGRLSVMDIPSFQIQTRIPSQKLRSAVLRRVLRAEIVAEIICRLPTLTPSLILQELLLFAISR